MQRQLDICEIQPSLVYIVSSRSYGAREILPKSKQPKQNKIKQNRKQFTWAEFTYHLIFIPLLLTFKYFSFYLLLIILTWYIYLFDKYMFSSLIFLAGDLWAFCKLMKSIDPSKAFIPYMYFLSHFLFILTPQFHRLLCIVPETTEDLSFFL